MKLTEWIQGVNASQLPERFYIDDDRLVLDPFRWLEKLKDDAKVAKSPRKRLGALQNDILLLHKFIEGIEPWKFKKEDTREKPIFPF